MRTVERPQTGEEWQHPDDHICYDGDLCATIIPPRVIDRWGKFDQSDRVCDPFLGAELHTLSNPLQTVYTARQTTGGRVLTTYWTDGDMLEQQRLSEGCEWLRHYGQAREVEVIVLEEGEDVEP